MFKGTPGPWMAPHFVRDDVRCNCAYVFSESQVGMGSICTIDHGAEDEPLEIAKANARLIAATPDLAFQLLAAANYIDTLGGDSKSYRIAIAKATS